MKQMTPLSKFPTEVLLMNFRSQRFCETRLPWTIETHFNHGTSQWEYWEVVLGSFEIDGTLYEDMPVAYTKIAYDKKTRSKINKMYTTTSSRFLYSDEVRVKFDGMTWEGKISELKAELDKRPNVEINGRKEFRKWKIEYKKSRKR